MKKLFAVLCAALLVAAFTVPAMAETKVGGILFVDAYYYDRDVENVAGGVPVGTPTGGLSDFSETNIEVPNITRFYVRWTNEDNVGLYFESGHGGTFGNGAGWGVRHAYGWWDVNPGFRLMAGQSTTPFSPLNPSQLIGTTSGKLHVIGVGYGDYYPGRWEQVRGTFNLPEKMGRIEIALSDPSGGTNTVPTETETTFIEQTIVDENGNFIGTDIETVTTTTPLGTEQTVLPRIDVGADLYFGAFKLYPGFFWQTKEIELLPGVTAEDSYDSWGASIGAAFGFGPMNVSAEVNYGQNWGNEQGLIGLSPAATNAGVRYVDNDGDGFADDIEDSETLAWWVDVSFKLGAATPHLIVGSMSTENDGSVDPTDDTDVESWMYGVSVPITAAKGFTIRPEVFLYDDGDDEDVRGTKTNFGEELIAGIQFQITF